MLNEIVNKTKERYRFVGQRELEKMKEKCFNYNGHHRFFEALRNEYSIICEIKKMILESGKIPQETDYVKIAKEYEKAGAKAFSCPTEPFFFLGDNDYFKELKRQVKLPILRKDFIINEFQIYESAHIGADAILLICNLLDERTLEKFICIANSLGIDQVVEARNDEEIAMAIRCHAKIIEINNRNPYDYSMDIEKAKKIRREAPREIIFISESEIKDEEEIRKLRYANIQSFIIDGVNLSGFNLYK